MVESLLHERLAPARRLLVIGVGNELMGDDAAGILLARSLRRSGRLSKKVRVVEAGMNPENSISVISRFNPSHILIIDIARMGLTPGSMRVLDKAKISGFSFSTHTLPLSFIVDYFEKKPGVKDIILIGIEPLGIEFGEEISQQVKGSMDSLERILERTFPRRYD